MNKKLFLPFLLVCLSGIFSAHASMKQSSTPGLSVSFYIKTIEKNSSFSNAIKENFGIQLPTSGLINASIETKLLSLSERSSLNWGFNGGVTMADDVNTRLSHSNFRVDLLLKYTLLQQKHFALTGTGGLGFGVGYLHINKTNVNLPPSATISEVLLNSRDYRFMQKGIGVASLGLQADWLVDEIGSVGVFVRWSQQLGAGSYYTSNFKTKVKELSKSEIFPLEIGLVLSIRKASSDS